MTCKIGYLLPTRESVMEGRPEAEPLLKLAERAEQLNFDSVWVGDSIIARPRHEPMTLLAGVAGRTKRVKLGTAVLLPALRNPVILAHCLRLGMTLPSSQKPRFSGNATDPHLLKRVGARRRRSQHQRKRH